MVKEKSKDGGSNDLKANWKDPKELQAFCEFCAIQVIDGKRKGGFLTKIGVDAVIEQLGAMGKVVTHLRIKNKWDHLKKKGGSSLTSVLRMTLGSVMILELGCLRPVSSGGPERLRLVHIT